MFQKLVSHNDDFKRLLDIGYSVAIDSTNHMIIRDIPYLNATGELKIGSIVSKLKFIDRYRFEQQDHQIYFTGDLPCDLEGNTIKNMGGGPCSISLSSSCSDIKVTRSFSNKPKAAGRYKDHFHKIETYVAFISGPAIQKYGVTPYTFNASTEADEDPIFKYRDTLTSRSNISDLTEGFENEVVAIIGLGGTGSYVLDFMVKTPVQKIIGFDSDHYHVHNAFRSPGRLEEDELGKSKADVYRNRYDGFRRGLSLKSLFLDETTKSELNGVTFAFVCVDNGDSRSVIFDLLIELQIPFIDVGLGLKRDKDMASLSGMLRATYFPIDAASQVRDKKWASESEDPNNLYKSNIQISELNALNACLAVLQYKKLRSFYCADSASFNSLFNIRSSKIISESILNED